MSHDPDSITEGIRLFHTVSREDDRSSALEALDQFPRRSERREEE